MERTLKTQTLVLWLTVTPLPPVSLPVATTFLLPVTFISISHYIILYILYFLQLTLSSSLLYLLLLLSASSSHQESSLQDSPSASPSPSPSPSSSPSFPFPSGVKTFTEVFNCIVLYE
jgi:hypothetical protein